MPPGASIAAAAEPLSGSAPFSPAGCTPASQIREEVAELRRRLDFLLRHDALTLLPNRLQLRQRFERAAAPGAALTLMAVDLCDFKHMRDNLGHADGDALLLQAAHRLLACLQPDALLSHHGGGEFTILLTGDAGDARQIGQALHAAFVEPFELDGLMLALSLSIGIALFPADGRTYDEVQKAAGIALAHAADGTRGGCTFCTGQMRDDTDHRMRLHGQLRNAIGRDELLLHYQPQLSVGSGRMIGMEALLRWQRTGGGMEYPGSFIPLAERSGMIVPIGEWVLNEACRQARAWQDQGHAPLTVAVNLSALQFRHGDIVATVAAALRRSGLAPAQLELELTESILLHDSDSVNRSLQALKTMGVALSIDDFGTGYSNLSYLKSLAVDKLKIDQSFVRGLGEDAGNSAIVKAIIQLGHTLQLSVIAEGVETGRQLEELVGLGCDAAQGYYFSKPLSAVQFGDLLRQQSCLNDDYRVVS
ncbi:putative bifunctional diguanylate cyclase/phosphodiesterase [Duganella hordei]|uniref:putative bifunctional diguanylate cyclase/phosphodiesterase n=1 Tax=Duganella hordei TaxID=2865934 RepID=UPI0030E908E0